MRIIARLCLLLALLPCLTEAEIYKWRDAEGNTVYSQTAPPADVPRESVKTRPAPTEASETARRRLDAIEKRLAEQRKQRDETAQKAREEAKRRATLRDSCARVRTALQELEYKINPLIPDGKGGYRRMTTEEHDAKVRELRAQLEQHCR